MHDMCHNCFLFLVALAGGFVGVMLANTSLAVLLWVCTKMEQLARQQSEWRR
jgi:hypothetical protein